MTTATSRPAPPVAAATDLRRKLAAIAVVGGALALAAGRVITLPGGTPAQRIEQAHGHQGQIAVELVLVVFGLLATMAGLVAVAAGIRGRGARLATAGACGCVLGCALVVQMTLDAVNGAAAAVDNDAAMRQFLAQLDSSPAIAVVTPIAVLGYFFGPFLVALAARRAGSVPVWLPWGVLVSLPLQSVGESLRGPFFAQVADAFLQLLLVAMLVVLARRTLLSTGAPDTPAPTDAPH